MKKILNLLIIPFFALWVSCNKENKLEANKCPTCEDFIGVQPYVYEYTKYNENIYKTCYKINDTTLVIYTRYFSNLGQQNFETHSYLKICGEDKK